MAARLPRATTVLSRTIRTASAPSSVSVSVSVAASTRAAPQRHRLHTTAHRPASKPPRGPTDLSALNVLGDTEAPSTTIEGATRAHGFRLNNGVHVAGGDGIFIIGGEAFRWRPWRVTGAGGGASAAAKAAAAATATATATATTEAVADNSHSGHSTQHRHTCVDSRGQFEAPKEAFGILEALWPRPDMIVLGVGTANRPLAPDTRQYLASLGVRVEVADTGKATGQYNLLATERGQDQIAAALMPLT